MRIVIDVKRDNPPSIQGIAFIALEMQWHVGLVGGILTPMPSQVVHFVTLKQGRLIGILPGLRFQRDLADVIGVGDEEEV
jgi:hypothetical protein